MSLENKLLNSVNILKEAAAVLSQMADKIREEITKEEPKEERQIKLHQLLPGFRFKTKDGLLVYQKKDKPSISFLDECGKLRFGVPCSPFLSTQDTVVCYLDQETSVILITE